MIKYFKKSHLTWQVGCTADKNVLPDSFIQAVVPGAVQLDFAAHGNYPDINFADNYQNLAWMEDQFYRYRTTFDRPHIEIGQRVWFISKGIDYQFEIVLNGQRIYSQEGMFSPVECDITDRLADDNTLDIIIYPAPKRHADPQDRTQASNVVKPAVSYLWDWHPRLIPLGIWDDTFLEIRHSSYLQDLYINYTLSDDFKQADLNLNIESIDCCGVAYQWTLTDADGATVLYKEGVIHIDKELVEVCFPNPQLWWTHDHGTPYLYHSCMIFIDKLGCEISRAEQTVGFRRVRMVMNTGGWDEPKGFPKSRSAAPAQIELNGRRLFAKGSNFVAPDIFPGRITADRYAVQIAIARKSNFNILRSWGGAAVGKEAFFDSCDREGILVWQEFPLACNLYPDESHYLTILKKEATSIVRRVRKHPCLALWCGGNELFNSWSKMTDQSLPLRLLNAVCYELSPQIPFNATSPLNGMAHGHYVFCWEGREVYQWMHDSHYTAYTEFGIPGISPQSVLEKIIPAKDLFPPKAGTAWEEHHAFGAWDGDMSTWLCQHILTKYFGQAQSLSELIEQSSIIQSEGYKAIFEEARRKKPYTSMALNWCFNEPWPSAANNSLVVYPDVEKPALKAVANSCRPLLASARFDKYQWVEEEVFCCDLWVLNDRFEKHDSLKINVYLSNQATKIKILEWLTPEIDSNANCEGPAAKYKLPSWNTDRFDLIVEVEGDPSLSSSYTLAYRAQKAKIAPVTASMNYNE